MNQVDQCIETEISDSMVMNFMPVVSVLMSTYNHEAYIAEAIEGVVGQKTDFHFELIIGEDCSTDNTRRIALDFQRRYPKIIRVVFSDRNIGAFNNMNRMFPKARGEFVAWCEGDDFWHNPSKLQKQVDFMRANPDYGLVGAQYDRLVHTAGSWRRIENWCSRKYGSIPQGNVSLILPVRMYVKTCAMMGRTQLVKQHFDSNLRSAENSVGDRPLILHMSMLAKIACLAESMATYRRTPGSHVNSGFESLLLKRKKKIAMDNRLAEAIGMDEKVRMEMQRKNYRLLLYFAAATRNQEVFDEAFRWLDVNYPRLVKERTVKLWAFLIKRKALHSAYFGLRRMLVETLLFLKRVRPGIRSADEGSPI